MITSTASAIESDLAPGLEPVIAPLRPDASQPLTPLVLAPGEGEMIYAYDIAIRVLLPFAATGGEFSLLDMKTAPQSGPPYHLHTLEDEYFYILEGRFEFCVDGRTFEASPGDFAYGPRNIPHTWRVIGDEPGRLLVGLTPGDLEAFFRRTQAKAAIGADTPESRRALSGEYGMTFLPPSDEKIVNDPLFSPRLVRSAEGEWMQGLCERARLLLSAQESGNRMLVGEIEADPHGGPPPHLHTREDEGFLVLDGQFEFRVGERCVEAGPGVFVYGPRNVPHAWRCVGEKPGRLLAFIWPGDFETFYGEMVVMAANDAFSPEAFNTLALQYGITLLPEL